MVQHTTPRPSRWRRAATLLSAVAVAAGLLTVAPTAAAAAPPEGKGQILLTVTDAETRGPVEMAYLSAWDGSSGQQGGAVTGTDGTALIDLAPGTYSVDVFAEQYERAYVPGVLHEEDAELITVRAGQVVARSIALDRGASGTVAVTHGGAAASGIDVEIMRHHELGWADNEAWCTTGPAGTCSLRGLRPGTYSIHAYPYGDEYTGWGNGTYPAIGQTFEVAQDGIFTASIALAPATSIAGTVDLDFEHPSTYVGGWVRVLYDDAPDWESTPSAYFDALPGDTVPFQLQVEDGRAFRLELEAFDYSSSAKRLIMTQQWTPTGMARVGTPITVTAGQDRSFSLTGNLGAVVTGTVSIDPPADARAASDEAPAADARQDERRAAAAHQRAALQERIATAGGLDSAADAGAVEPGIWVDLYERIGDELIWAEGIHYGRDDRFGVAQPFEITGLTPGSYVVEFGAETACWEFWEDTVDVDEATPVGVTLSGFTTPIAATLANAADGCGFDGPSELPTPERVAGANRFGTSVEISQRSFPGTADVVYLASGTNYPDGLAAGPAAAHEGGPVLLTPRNAVPDVVLAEIRRLQPSKVVIVGGAPSVSAAAEAQVRALDTKREVVRLGGGNRFETSRLIAEHAFGETGAPGAFVATGLKFPDALAAGPAASLLGGPVLLVNGTVAAPDAATLATLDDLGVHQLGIAGDARSVSTGIETGIRSQGIVVERFAGGNRFETAAAISGLFEYADTVHVASGEGFADALPGAAAAGTAGGPLLLSRGGCMPAITHESLQWFMPYDVVLLGGTPTLSTNVASYGLCR